MHSALYCYALNSSLQFPVAFVAIAALTKLLQFSSVLVDVIVGNVRKYLTLCKCLP